MHLWSVWLLINIITHVLVFCERTYAKKADTRKAGVGTETQIISKEVYDKNS